MRGSTGSHRAVFVTCGCFFSCWNGCSCVSPMGGCLFPMLPHGRFFSSFFWCYLVADRPTDRSTDRPIDRPTNRPTDQSTNRPTDRQALSFFLFRCIWFLVSRLLFVVTYSSSTILTRNIWTVRISYYYTSGSRVSGQSCTGFSFVCFLFLGSWFSFRTSCSFYFVSSCLLFLLVYCFLVSCFLFCHLPCFLLCTSGTLYFLFLVSCFLYFYYLLCFVLLWLLCFLVLVSCACWLIFDFFSPSLFTPGRCRRQGSDVDPSVSTGEVWRLRRRSRDGEPGKKSELQSTAAAGVFGLGFQLIRSKTSAIYFSTLVRVLLLLYIFPAKGQRERTAHCCCGGGNWF